MKKASRDYGTQEKIGIMGIPEAEVKVKGAESMFKIIMGENFLNLGREMDIQIHEAQKTQIG